MLYNTFSWPLTMGKNKLECLSVVSFFKQVEWSCYFKGRQEESYSLNYPEKSLPGTNILYLTVGDEENEFNNIDIRPTKRFTRPKKRSILEKPRRRRGEHEFVFHWFWFTGLSS
jgi:hypothetical protein